MKIHIARDTYTKKSTQGSLYLDGSFFCYTLEPPASIPFQPGDPICVPAGFYPATTYESPKWSARYGYPFLVVELRNIPGRSEIEIHIGNRPADTLGCILVGGAKSQDAIDSSEDAFYRLMHRIAGSLPHDLLSVEITDIS